MFDTSKIGYSFPPFTVHLDRRKIRELGLAIGDNNPIYQDQAGAQAAGYADVPFFPTAGTMFLFWDNIHFIAQMTELGLDVERFIHLEESYEYLAPLRPGETLTGRMMVADGASRKQMDLVTLQFHYSNQQGQEVLIATSRFMARG